MTKDEALKLALEALSPDPHRSEWVVAQDMDKAITAIKEALAQPEQLREENERLHVENRRLIDRIESIGVPVGVGGFATTTSQHTWVGLTDEAIWLEYQRFWPFHPAEEPTLAKDIAKFANAIEAKLKEKNNG